MRRAIATVLGLLFLALPPSVVHAAQQFQWGPDTKKSLASYVKEGYELKAVTSRGGDLWYFLQPKAGKNLVLCIDSQDLGAFCREVTEPHNSASSN